MTNTQNTYQSNFLSLDLIPELQKNIPSLGFEKMTPIQTQSLPSILAGKDVIAQGKSGSGKTMAFSIGVLNKLDIKSSLVQALILCPTRELADQVAKEIRKLARTIDNVKVLTLCGGMPFKAQKLSLENGVHIIVGTPGRIEDHLGKGTLELDDVNMLVIDEADRMLEMGFQTTLDTIIERVSGQHQTLLFSATYPDKIQSIATRVMIEPVMVKVSFTHGSSSIQQHFYEVDDDEHRRLALRLLLLKHSPESSVIFCNTKKDVKEIASDLLKNNFSALALHGDLEQKDRDQILVRFANKSESIMVATDVAARGLDVEGIDAVINYHLAVDPEMHIHRIGRTGRAGNKGFAYSLYGEKESHKVSMLGEYQGQIIESDALPSTASLEKTAKKPSMATIQIDCRKKQKVRPGDILGALTGAGGIAGKQVGKIDIFDYCAYVAVARDVVKPALKKLADGKLKGRSFRSRVISWT